MRVGIGVRDHSGWAVAVALGVVQGAPLVLERRRLLLCDPSLPRQAYHAGEHAGLEEARGIVTAVEESARTNSRRELESLVRSLRGAGHDVAGIAVAGRPGETLPPLEAILRSHSLLHAAEGQLYREALAEAAESWLPVRRFVQKELFARAASALGTTPDALRATLAALGKPLGPPWTADQKEAAAAAWIVLGE